MFTRRHFAGLLAASALTPLDETSAVAQAPQSSPSSPPTSWPNRPVRFICPIAAGGSIDAVSRLVAARLGDVWHQQTLVENRTGNINIGAEAAARSEPDGYTIFAAPSSLAMTGFLSPSLNYDPVGDFAPVSLIGTWPNIMVVPISSPARSVQEFIAYAKANRGKITYASGGHGSSLHLAGEMFKRITGVEMTHIPYRGAAPAFNDLIPGRVDVMFNLISSSLPLIKAGQIRGLAVATPERAAVLPDIPTLDESGVPGMELSSWIALFVPVKTPAEIVRKIHADTVVALADPATRRKLLDMGVTPIGSTPAELAAQVRADMERWGPLIKEAGISARD